MFCEHIGLSYRKPEFEIHFIDLEVFQVGFSTKSVSKFLKECKCWLSEVR